MKSCSYSNLLLLIILALQLSGCIEEDNSNCVQYIVTPSPIDSAGNTIPAAVKGNLQAYLFINGKFDRIVTADADGKYLVSYDGRQGTASLVAIGLSNADSAKVFTPAEGDDIGSMSVSVVKDSASGTYVLPSCLYYGKYDYDSQTAGSKSVDTAIVMLNKPVTLHVVIKQLKDFFGNYNNYRVVVSGFRSTMTFSGEIKGDSIEYTPDYVFDSNNQLITNQIRAFPTKTGEYVTVSVYRGNTLIWTTAKDENGKYVSLKSGEDKVLIVDCGRRDLFMSVQAWEEYKQSVIIP